VNLSEQQKKKLEELWLALSGVEGSAAFSPTSVILDCPEDIFSYLHRGTQTLAFRLPASANLRELLLKTGPLIAPSANIEGLPPAKNIEEARNYFGDAVDLYMDGETIAGKASRVVRLHNDGSITILRE
jgi:L-threonylcarbamoyladenylate synthase